MDNIVKNNFFIFISHIFNSTNVGSYCARLCSFALTWVFLTSFAGGNTAYIVFLTALVIGVEVAKFDSLKSFLLVFNTAYGKIKKISLGLCSLIVFSITMLISISSAIDVLNKYILTGTHQQEIIQEEINTILFNIQSLEEEKKQLKITLSQNNDQIGAYNSRELIRLGANPKQAKNDELLLKISETNKKIASLLQEKNKQLANNQVNGIIDGMAIAIGKVFNIDNSQIARIKSISVIILAIIVDLVASYFVIKQSFMKHEKVNVTDSGTTTESQKESSDDESSSELTESIDGAYSVDYAAVPLHSGTQSVTSLSSATTNKSRPNIEEMISVMSEMITKNRINKGHQKTVMSMFGVGYTTAKLVMDQLEKNGLVTKPNGSHMYVNASKNKSVA